MPEFSRRPHNASQVQLSRAVGGVASLQPLLARRRRARGPCICLSGARRRCRDRGEDGWFAAVLLLLVVAILVLTLIELAMRGAPWSESGYRGANTVRPIAAPLTFVSWRATDSTPVRPSATGITEHSHSHRGSRDRAPPSFSSRRVERRNRSFVAHEPVRIPCGSSHRRRLDRRAAGPPITSVFMTSLAGPRRIRALTSRPARPRSNGLPRRGRRRTPARSETRPKHLSWQ